MAVHPEYPGLTVQVMVNGKPLPEYDDADTTEDPKVVTKYIEAQAGTEFEILRVFPDGFAGLDDVGTSCYIDGREVRARVSTIAERKSFPMYSFSCVKEKKGNRWFRRSFQFRRLCVTEASGTDNPGKAAEIGTIKLDFHVGKKGGSTQSSGQIRFKGPEQVSEAALKGEAKSLGFELGSAKETSRKTKVKFEPKDRKPVATFIFKYRSRTDLQALHIIPRPRSTPVPPVASVPTEPASQQQTSVPPASTDQDGLTTEEIIVMIASYRGHDQGLLGQSQRSLLSLLKHYESKDSGSTQGAKDTRLADERITIKRERSDDSGAGGRQKKRKEREVIVLDD